MNQQKKQESTQKYGEDHEKAIHRRGNWNGQ